MDQSVAGLQQGEALAARLAETRDKNRALAAGMAHVSGSNQVLEAFQMPQDGIDIATLQVIGGMGMAIPRGLVDQLEQDNAFVVRALIFDIAGQPDRVGLTIQTKTNHTVVLDRQQVMDMSDEEFAVELAKNEAVLKARLEVELKVVKDFMDHLRSGTTTAEMSRLVNRVTRMVMGPLPQQLRDMAFPAKSSMDEVEENSEAFGDQQKQELQEVKQEIAEHAARTAEKEAAKVQEYFSPIVNQPPSVNVFVTVEANREGGNRGPRSPRTSLSGPSNNSMPDETDRQE